MFCLSKQKIENTSTENKRLNLRSFINPKGNGDIDMILLDSSCLNMYA